MFSDPNIAGLANAYRPPTELPPGLVALARENVRRREQALDSTMRRLKGDVWTRIPNHAVVDETRLTRRLKKITRLFRRELYRLTSQALARTN